MTQSRTNKRWCHLVLCMAQFLDVFLILVIILPIITDSLKASPSESQWILSAYNLTFGGLLLLFGRLTDLFGKKKGFLIGMAWLTLASVYCGFAPTTNHLIFARALQGMGAAANIPSAVGAITDLFDDPKERNIALSQFGAASPLGFICGLFVCGTIGESLGWRAVFFLYAGLTLLVLILGAVVLPADKPVKRDDALNVAKNMDYLGAVLSTGSLILFIYAITAGTEEGWSTPQILSPLLLSFVGAALFLYWERKVQNPLVPSSFFNPQTTLLLLMTFLVLFAFNGFAVFANLALLNIYHLSTVMTAVHLIPMMVVGFTTATATGYLATKYPYPLPFLIFGHVSMILACVLYAFVNGNISYWALAFPALCFIVLGFDVVFNFFNILLMSSVSVEHRSFAGGVLNTVVQLGYGVGIAVEFTVAGAVTTSLSNGSDLGSNSDENLMKGYAATFWIGVGLLVVSLGFGVAFRHLWKMETGSESSSSQAEIVELEDVKKGAAGFIPA
ncbi:major facilitator superfamily domain-containing protein [Obelidium mucronatum]|nr:major facilitator superfamily domain-containing protein [Obelidium mucronatum]